jgi:hypothetical protein
MSTFSIKQTGDDISIRLNGLSKSLAKLPAEAALKMRDLTPIRTGYARRNTKLRNKRTIIADYNYATDLDDGKSKQAPRGMTEPLFEWLQTQSADIARKAR